MVEYEPQIPVPKLDLKKVKVIEKEGDLCYSHFRNRKNRKYIGGIICLDCHTFVYSSARHDWQPCPCYGHQEAQPEDPEWDPNKNIGCYIDGGFDYERIGGWDKRYIFAWVDTDTGEVTIIPPGKLTLDRFDQLIPQELK